MPLVKRKINKKKVKVSKNKRGKVIKNLKRKGREREAEKSDLNISKDTKRSRYTSGMFWSNKMRQSFVYRSAYELAFFHILEGDEEVDGYLVEPFHVPYRYQGQIKRYYPDIVIFYRDNSREIVEIKPKNFVNLPQVKAKARGAKEYIRAKMPGCTYRMVTEEDIFKHPEDYRKFMKLIKNV